VSRESKESQRVRKFGETGGVDVQEIKLAQESYGVVCDAINHLSHNRDLLIRLLAYSLIMKMLPRLTLRS
jgi:hypothetical protein